MCDKPSIAAEKLGTFARENNLKRFALIAEPEGMEHQLIAAPRVKDRKMFAVVAPQLNAASLSIDEDHGWAVEPTWPGGSGGTFQTMFHNETTPVLLGMQQVIEDQAPKAELKWAYTWFSVLLALGSKERSSVPMAGLLVAEHGIALAVVSPVSARKVFTTPEVGVQAWDDVKNQLMDLGIALEPAGEGTGRRGTKARFTVCALEVDLRTVCPFWDSLVAAVALDMIEPEKLVVQVANKAIGPSLNNLMESFPRPYDLDRAIYRGMYACVGLVAAAIITHAVAHKRYTTQADAQQNRYIDESKTLQQLHDNKAAIQKLEESYSVQLAALPGGRGTALRRLAEITPEAITLTHFTLSEDGTFRLEGSLVDETYGDLATFRGDLNREGFAIAVEGGWIVAPSKHEFSAKGFCQLVTGVSKGNGGKQ